MHHRPAQGRALEVGPKETAQRTHREWMVMDAAKAVYRRHQGLIERVFGALKERQMQGKRLTR